MIGPWSAIEDFEALLDREIPVHAADTTFVVRLVEASRLGAAPPIEGGRAPFRVVFETIDALRIPQGTYAFGADEAATTAIFVVPIAATAGGGTRLEAVFS